MEEAAQGQVRSQLYLLDKLLATVEPALDSEGKDRTWSVRQILPHEGISRGWVADPSHCRMCFQKSSHRPGVVDMALHAKGKRLQTQEEKKGIERRQSRPDIA